MGQTYYSVKVTIASLGPNRYRSRVEQFPRGANRGAGNDFDLDCDNPGSGLPAIPKLVSMLSTSSVAPSTLITDFGQWLFGLVFRDDVRAEYSVAERLATMQKSRFRICLSIQSPPLINIPWEFLHDKQSFLIHKGYSIVRVLDELYAAKSSFAPVQRVLVAVANPSGDYDQFDSSAHLEALKQALKKAPGMDAPTILEHASPDQIRTELAKDDFDAFYFVGHGEYSNTGGELICETGDGVPEALDASVLAAHMRDARRLRFVYLNACSSAKTAEKNPFEGVAQRLMLDGDVAAAAAMQVDVTQSSALRVAERFFEELSLNGPEDALLKARLAVTDPDWGIPVLYSYVDAPQQYETNRLMTFLSAKEDDDYALILPSFYLGFPAEGGQPEIPKNGPFRFPGESFARADVEAAAGVMRLLNRVTSPRKISIIPRVEAKDPRHSHVFLFGSKSNPSVAYVLREFSKRFQFEYEPARKPDSWIFKDSETGKEYIVTAPNRLDLDQYQDTEDYGVIQKVRKAGDKRVFFILAGLGSRATHGCGLYLEDHWEDLLKEHGDRDFAVVLRFPAGLGPSEGRPV